MFNEGSNEEKVAQLVAARKTVTTSVWAFRLTPIAEAERVAQRGQGHRT